MITTATQNKPPARFSHEANQALQDQAQEAGRRAVRPGPMATLAVYNAIQRHADPHGYAFPSLVRIAATAGCSPRTASRAVAVLRDAGILSVTPGSGRTASRYQLHYPETDRGCSPIHYDRPRAVPPTPPPRRDILEIYRSPEALQAASQEYAVNELGLIHALQHAREQQPRHLAAYLSRMLERHRTGEQPLPGWDAETRLHLQADLRHLRNGRALA